MKTSLPASLPDRLPQVLLVFVLLAIYLNALAPGLTWANGGSDGGDLITAAATGGIAQATRCTCSSPAFSNSSRSEAWRFVRI
jgi:hypothetical protein